MCYLHCYINVHRCQNWITTQNTSTRGLILRIPSPASWLPSVPLRTADIGSRSAEIWPVVPRFLARLPRTRAQVPRTRSQGRIFTQILRPSNIMDILFIYGAIIKVFWDFIDCHLFHLVAFNLIWSLDCLLWTYVSTGLPCHVNGKMCKIPTPARARVRSC